MLQMGMEENQSLEDLQSQEDSSSSSSTSTIIDLLEDASSSSSPPSPTCSPPPIKKGLSRYYGGKSQSFTSLESVKSLEDLPKKENPYNINMRMKLSRSYADGLDGNLCQQSSQRFCSPKHSISKRVSSRGSFLSTMVVGRNDLLSTCNRPPIPIQK